MNINESEAKTILDMFGFCRDDGSLSDDARSLAGHILNHFPALDAATDEDGLSTYADLRPLIPPVEVEVTHVASIGKTIYSAWEPTKFRGDNTSLPIHSTVKRSAIDGRPVGMIGTRDLPAEIEALPEYSYERSIAAQGWRASEHGRAYVAILLAHREAGKGRYHDGQIEVEA